MAPTSFQSPAPIARMTTKGNSMSNPNPAPSRPAMAPADPAYIVFAAIPTSKPGTVSQLGMRRDRQSSHPAVNAKIPAMTSVTSLIWSRYIAPHQSVGSRYCHSEIGWSWAPLANIGIGKNCASDQLESRTTCFRADFHIGLVSSQRAIRGSQAQSEAWLCRPDEGVWACANAKKGAISRAFRRC
jgi:hypothetical protein